ncbi:hypothetical protein [Dongia sp.]|uniref:hypothetical protein n=1 Tax=Dongia sp. TaxID=1977262 RepID=UPI0035AFE707
MSGSAKMSGKKAEAEVLTESVRQRAQAVSAKQSAPAAEEARFANIQSNAFFKVMFAEESRPEEKKSAVAKMLTFEGTKEENREKIREFELFKEYLQAQREAMAQEIIRLTDTETFSELKMVYDDLNTALIEFDQKMRPLTDIIDAVYTLRTNGLTVEAFQEIIRDRKAEEKLRADRELKQQELTGLKSRIERLTTDNAIQGEKKSFFGFGGVTEEARQQIAKNDVELSDIHSRLSALSGEIAELDRQVPSESQLGEFAEQKKKLRELLDITTEEHKQRQQDLVSSALNFVNTAKARVGAVRQHLGKMGDQVENLADANNVMGTVYAVMNEGIKAASTDNVKLRESLQAAAPDEDTIAQMTRDQKRMAVEQHMSLLDASASDTMATYADLTSGAIRIKTMKDAVDQQSIRARTMHSQGISGVADRLSVVLQAVSSAALGEASAMAKDTLQMMADNTNKVAQKESIRIAMGIEEQNADLSKAIDDLGSYGEVVRAATNITKEGLTEMQGKLAELKKLTEVVQDDFKGAIAVNADIASAKPAAEKASSPAAPSSTSPFKFGTN